MKNVVFTYENGIIRPFMLSYPLEKIFRINTGKASDFLMTDENIDSADKELLEDCASLDKAVFRIELIDGCVMYHSENWIMTIE